MYSEYYNFKISKKKNTVKLSADVRCILETIEDDFIVTHTVPKCLTDIVDNKLFPFCYQTFNVCTLTVPYPNKVTDYKKIWKLCGFEKDGNYDGYYDCNIGRVYLGIYDGTLNKTEKTLPGTVRIYIPKDALLPNELIFNIFKKNCIELDLNKESVLDVLNDLQKLIKGSIIVYGDPYVTEVYVFGDRIEELFAFSDMPQDIIVEA